MSTVVVTACFGSAPRWETYGVPCPSIREFGYQIDAGLLRTPMESGYSRQRRRYTHRPTTYQLSWLLTTPQLHAWEALLDKAYNWLYVPMVTGQVPKWMATDHLIRFTSDPSVSLESKDLWAVTVTAEQYKIDAACVLEQSCDELAACLEKQEHTWPQPKGWDDFVAHWGDKTEWGAPNG